MTLRALIVVSILAAVVGIVFGLWPQLDLALARSFVLPPDGFVTSHVPAFAWFRSISMWPTNAFWVVSLLLLLGKLFVPRWKLPISSLVLVFIIATTVLGPFVLMNGILKQHSGRPRPVATVDFGGKWDFKPWWNMTGQCTGNCSFASGESSHGFWLVAPAALLPPPYRATAYAVAIAYGGVVAVLRMAFGAHYFTDVFFGAYFTYLIVWGMYGLLFRWPRTRLNDEAIEGGIERAGHALRGWFRRADQRLRIPIRPPRRVPGTQPGQPEPSAAPDVTPPP